jgi:hypothetical protein
MIKAIVFAAVLFPTFCLGQSSEIEAAVAVPLWLKINHNLIRRSKVPYSEQRYRCGIESKWE